MDANSLVASLLVAGTLGAGVSLFLAKTPYVRGWFAAQADKSFAGESRQLGIVILLTVITGVLAFLYVHQKALALVTADDLIPLAVAIIGAVGGSQFYNVQVNLAEKVKAAQIAASTQG